MCRSEMNVQYLCRVLPEHMLVLAITLHILRAEERKRSCSAFQMATHTHTHAQLSLACHNVMVSTCGSYFIPFGVPPGANVRVSAALSRLRVSATS